ncbi:probable tRNA (uracil-O(2)-)-methyltransferase isoform X1 [Anopheles albimanus]|uniref:tRNA (uracil-O(2)-)-methyltransferase n=1 Tax=Anopheles albimanus TaxID=7167 RepID=A0A182FDT0_ANOAL|nr:probable tRNA (uracil-O(2)-)-methyltransferase isoform X1 [Anopheles albimanus]
MLDRIIAESCSLSVKTVPCFWQAVDIYLFKTHVVNKKLFGVKTVSLSTYKHRDETDEHDLVERFFEERDLEQNLSNLGYEITRTEQELNNLSVDRLACCGADGLIIVNRLLPKNVNSRDSLDVVCLVDFRSHTLYLKRQRSGQENNLFPSFAFVVQAHSEGKLSIRCRSGDATDDRSIVWLRDVLLCRMMKWIEASTPRSEMTDGMNATVHSLALIDDMEEYNRVFHELKQKYGLSMVSIWPECTDPQKFVFEDIAIATYLIVLWRQERRSKGGSALQSFVDLGCGNGLLVYILASEGHRGYGIDLRKRKLWDLYPGGTTDLRVQSLVPSDASLFPDIDWIIGNHSDELSPWIPVIAARSSHSCRFFLLPCCAYEFDGSKYQRQNCALSQYGDFLQYAKQIAEVCGFLVGTDRLRIPSTKRTCIIGCSRSYPREEYASYDRKIQAFIDERSKQRSGATLPSDAKADGWSANFKPRESTEKVRNCTKIDRSIVDKIVAMVFQALLAKKRLLADHGQGNWNAGGTLSMGDLVETIPQQYLTALKAECGGLQTLLKNNHQIFLVHNGTVQLRIPRKTCEMDESTVVRRSKKVKNYKPVNLKQKTCWFFRNHPDGCPLEEADCRFNHEK